MNLKELYAQTSREEHGNIIVHGERVYVRSAEGVEEYLLQGDDRELVLLRSDKSGPLAAVPQDLAQIKAELGVPDRI